MTKNSKFDIIYDYI